MGAAGVGLLPVFCLEGGHAAVEDVIGRAMGIDANEQVLFFKVVGEGGGAIGVGLHADLDGFGAVIFTLEEVGAAEVAFTFDFRGLSADVVDRFAMRAGAAAAEAGDDFVDGEFVIEDAVEFHTEVAEHFLEGFGLAYGSGEAIEEESAFAAEAAEAFADHIEDRGIGDEFATFHVIDGFIHGCRAFIRGEAAGGAEDIAGGEVAGAESVGDEFGLGAFTDSGCAE